MSKEFKAQKVLKTIGIIVVNFVLAITVIIGSFILTDMTFSRITEVNKAEVVERLEDVELLIADNGRRIVGFQNGGGRQFMGLFSKDMSDEEYAEHLKNNAGILVKHKTILENMIERDSDYIDIAHFYQAVNLLELQVR